MGSLVAHATSRLSPGVRHLGFSFMIFCFFVSSASGMTCGYLSRTGAAHCDLSFFCLVLLLSFHPSCSDLFTGRRQTGLAVKYYLDRT